MRNEEQIGYQIKELCRLLDKAIYYKGLLNTNGDAVTARDGWMLGYLYHRRDKEVFQKDMEADFHMAKSSVTAALQGLEKNGYIRREPVERDARLKKIVVTERGIQLHDSIKQSIEDMERTLAADLTPEQRQQLFAMWEQIKHRLEQEITSDKAKLGKK
ncbi:MAG: MarR family transcriptional regulator [Lachnospiraceae bacterium]|nr:MarR family transcriptional regulator [Lachnospiraceae bacterium]